MKTLVQGGWVISYRDGHHCMDRDHQVVYEGDQIIYTGPKFEGAVDKRLDAAGKLICPGFIDTHVHSGHRASHRLITDTGRPDYFGQPFLEISVPREGTRIEGDVRYLRPDEKGTDAELRSADEAPDWPRSLSITMMRSSGHPKAIARWRGPYCRLVLSVFSNTWCSVDWRT